MSSRPRRDELPPIRDIAESLRNGYGYDQLCDRYNITAHTLANRLSYAGYSTTGQPSRSETAPRPALLVADSDGNCLSGGTGGGDYCGLPYGPVLHSGRRRVFRGLDWSTLPASGPRWESVR